MPVVSADIEPLAIAFADDGLVPNNPMPFLVYQGAVAIDNAHPEKTIEGLVGAYPPGPKMDLQRPTAENHAKALRTIPDVRTPKTDPAMGADGPLVRLW